MPAAETSIEKIIGDITKKSATKQILIGAVSGWVTGFTSAKVGRVAALAVGSSLILLELAHENGVLKIDWCKINRTYDQVGDKLQEAVTGEGPKWMEKAERYVDRKIDQADSALKKQQKNAKKWYHSLIGDENGAKLNNFHIFLCAFTGGVAIGVISG